MGSQLNLKQPEGIFRQMEVGAAERELSAHRDPSFSEVLGLQRVALDSACCPNPLPVFRAKRWVRGNRACKGAEAEKAWAS